MIEYPLDWHRERLKAKIAIGRSLNSEEIIKAAYRESVDLRIQQEVGFTSHESERLLLGIISEPTAPTPIKSSDCAIGKIHKKRGAA